MDAIHVGLRIGGKKKDAVFVAYGIIEDGTLELLAIDMGSENATQQLNTLINKEALVLMTSPSSSG